MRNKDSGIYIRRRAYELRRGDTVIVLEERGRWQVKEVKISEIVLCRFGNVNRTLRLSDNCICLVPLEQVKELNFSIDGATLLKGIA